MRFRRGCRLLIRRPVPGWGGEVAPGDDARAKEILAAASAVLSHYGDVKTGTHDGYKPFFPYGKIGEESHYYVRAVG